MARKTLTIRQMFPNVDRDDFLDSRWAREIVADHGPLERLGDIANRPELANVEAGLRVPPPSITAHWRRSEKVEARVPVEPKQAIEFYRQGRYTIVMDMADHPAVQASLRALSKELGTPVFGTSCTAVAMPQGASAPLRWVEHELFVIQMSGRSTWNVAINEAIPNPTAAYAGPSGPHPEIVALAKDGAIERPSRTRRFALSPGSILHLPRGTWHRFKCEAEGVFLVLGLAAASWVDWFPAHARAGLVTDIGFRHPSTGATSGSVVGRKAAQAEVERLLPIFRERMRALGEDVFLGTRKPYERPRRRAVARARA